MTSDLNLAVERRSSTEKLKSKLQKQLSAYQDSSQASSSLLSKEVQQAVNQQQLLEKELHELRDESERKVRWRELTKTYCVHSWTVLHEEFN